MVSVAEWFRRKIVVLVYGGSIPFRHPITGTVVGSSERDRNSGRGSTGSDIYPGGEIWLDALDLGSSAVRHEGSSPSRGTNTTRSL